MCISVKIANLSSSGCWWKWLPLMVQIFDPFMSFSPIIPNLDFSLSEESHVHSWQDRKKPNKIPKMLKMQMELDFWKVFESLSSPWVVLLNCDIQRNVAEQGSFPGKVLTREPEISSSVFQSSKTQTGIFWVFKAELYSFSCHHSICAGFLLMCK